MKTIRLIPLLLLLFLFSCQEEDLPKFVGIIKEKGTTTYNYGTHILQNGDEFVALKSNNISLEFYLNQYVTIVGEKVPGYPVDGGPELIDVKDIIE